MRLNPKEQDHAASGGTSGKVRNKQNGAGQEKTGLGAVLGAV